MSRLPLICALCLAATLPAATLRQLSMNEMTQSATAIVRARVTGSAASVAVSGNATTIYTHYKLQVSETLKGIATTDVALPGGTAGTLRQSFPGVPDLQTGTEYVLFLWTSPSTGITHLIGMNQGMLAVTAQPDGTMRVARPRIGETMHDARGNVVRDSAVQMNLADLRARIFQLTGKGDLQ